MNTQAELFEAARWLTGMSLTEAADAMGVSVWDLILWEQGISTPDLDDLRKLIAAYDCDANWLITGTCRHTPPIELAA